MSDLKEVKTDELVAELASRFDTGAILLATPYRGGNPVAFTFGSSPLVLGLLSAMKIFEEQKIIRMERDLASGEKAKES